MKFRKALLTNFRNHAKSSLEFSGGVNIITGANAQGKTSVLEALSYICLTKSFLQQSDKTICRFGTESFMVDASLESDHGVTHDVHVLYEIGFDRKFFLDNNEMKKSADVIGMFPIVVLSPGDFALTFGAPSERRRFIDMVLSQVSRSYLEELMEYRRALKQRNKILLDGKIANSIDTELLDAWTNAVVDHGTKVMTKRIEFTADFQGAFRNAYQSLVGFSEVPRLAYEPSFVLKADNGTVVSIAEAFRDALIHLAKLERARGSSLAGPHRDDIAFTLNNAPIREFASQGQHKTFLVALKIAEFHYIKQKLGETPAMLLDDVMTELDYSRASKTISSVSNLGQSFVTVTDMINFDDKLLDTHTTKVLFVRDGNVEYEISDTMFGMQNAVTHARSGNV